MARHTSKAAQGSSEVANFFNVSPYFNDIILAADAGVPSNINASVVQGLSMDGSRYGVPFREVFLSSHDIGGGINTELLLSSDGRTWRPWWSGGAGSHSKPIQAAGLDGSGNALVAVNNNLVALTNTQSLFTAPSPTSVLHTAGNMGASGLLVAAGSHLKVVRDFDNNRWWAAGQNGSNVALWTWKSTITATGGWTEATTPGVTAIYNLAYGVGPSASAEAIVGCSNQAGIYAYVAGSSPGAGTAVDLTAATSMVFRGMVYNRYWDQWLFVDNVRGESTCAVMRCPSSSIGSANTADYEFITTYNNPTGFNILIANDATVTVELEGNQGALGPWCWFQCTNRQVLATPDMGNSWYYFSSPSLLNNSTLMPYFSVSQASGCLTICNWDNTTERSVVSRTGPLGTFSPFALNP